MPREESFKGWAGSPDNPQAKPFEYFYMKNFGRTFYKDREKISRDLIKTSCIQRATSGMKGDLFYNLMNSSLSNTCGILTCGDFYEEESTIKLPSITLTSCTPQGNDTLPEIRAFYEQLNINAKIHYKDCKPIATYPNIAGGEWAECECTVYMHIPGGRKSVWAQCIELEKKFRNKK